MAKKIKLLFVDDEERFLEALAQRLSLRDFEVTCARSAEEALQCLEVTSFPVALVDLKMPGMGGERLLDAIKIRFPSTEVVILTGHGSIDSAVACTRQGAYQYLQKPCETETLLYSLSAAYQMYLQKKQLVDQSKIDEVLQDAGALSPLGILRRLRDLTEA